MNNFKNVFLITLLLLSSITIAHAEENSDSSSSNHAIGLFVEPGVTYEFSSGSTIEYPGPFVTSDGSVYGLGILARVGVHVYDSLFLAADFRYSRPTFADSTHNLSSTADSYNMAIVAGAQIPIVGLRVFGSYVFAGGVNPGVFSNGLDVNYTGASGYRMGVGLHVLMISVNLEYQHIIYDTTIESLGPFTVNSVFANDKLRNSSFILSASFPLDL